MKAFLDTNVLVYAVSRADEDAAKRKAALALLAEADIHLSVQVVQEFIHVCQRKRRIGGDPDALRNSVETLLEFPCHAPGPSTVLAALDLQREHHLSWWDACILAAALESGCEVLYTEDFNDGQSFGRLRVENPFRAPPAG